MNMKKPTTLFRKAGKIDLRGPALFIISILMTSPFTGASQGNFDNIKIWEGWKTGSLIKVNGTIKYGDQNYKGEEDKRYLVVQTIDDVKPDDSKTIEISYNKELFSKAKDGENVTLLGYVSGGLGGIPNFGDYELEYWQDKSFCFSLYLVVLKMGDEIKMKKN
jgi:hypothetical protein